MGTLQLKRGAAGAEAPRAPGAAAANPGVLLWGKRGFVAFFTFLSFVGEGLALARAQDELSTGSSGSWLLFISSLYNFMDTISSFPQSSNQAVFLPRAKCFLSRSQMGTSSSSLKRWRKKRKSKGPGWTLLLCSSTFRTLSLWCFSSEKWLFLRKCSFP